MQAAFFDVDKTVIAKASIAAIGRPLYREGLISRRTILRTIYGQIVYMQLGADEAKLARIQESVLALTRGWDQARVREIVRETFADVIEPIIYREALDLINRHRRAGRKVVIISASPQEVVEPLAEHLSVDEVIGSRARVDSKGRYTGEMEFYAYGPNKATAIMEMAEREGIELDDSYAYSDSATDTPMLELVGHPVVVNPDKELLRVARERQWDIQFFDHPVCLRDRVPTPSRKTAIVATAIGAGVLAGGIVWSNRAARKAPKS